MIRNTRSTLAAALVSAALLASANVAAHEDHCEDTRLGDVMKDMKKSFKAYRGALKQGDWMAMSDARLKLSELSVSVTDEQPLKAREMNADERPELIEKYRKGMEKLDLLLGQLEQAEQSKDKGQVMALVKQVGAHTKKSHKALQLDCD